MFETKATAIICRCFFQAHWRIPFSHSGTNKHQEQTHLTQIRSYQTKKQKQTSTIYKCARAHRTLKIYEINSLMELNRISNEADLEKKASSGVA